MPRIVQCPKCRSLLQEPPGGPVYQCGSCSTKLQAKHASQADWEGSVRRMNVDHQLNRKSFSDSSSGEISDKVADEFALSGYGNDSPLYRRRGVPTSAEGALELPKSPTTDSGLDKGSHLGVTDPQQQLQQPQERIGDPSLNINTLELDMKQQLALETVSGADYHQNIGMNERWPANGISVSQAQHVQGQSRLGEISATSQHVFSSRVGTDYGAPFRSSHSMNGTSGAKAVDQSQRHSVLSSSASERCIARNRLNFGGIQTTSMNAQNFAVGNPAGAAAAARSKLKWQARDDPDSADDDEEECSSPGAASVKETAIKDDPISQDEMRFSATVKKTTSVEYVVERNWRTYGSRRHSMGGERGAEQPAIGRTPSQNSERAMDMYENTGSIGEYEPSESSSTTMDDGDNYSEGNAYRDMFQNSPPGFLDQRGALVRSASRPNLPRSNASSGRSLFSEESSSYGSQTETMNPDNHLDNARLVAASSRFSWDERVSRMGSASISGSYHQGPTPFSVRQRSTSYDYESTPSELLLPRVSSEPVGGFRPEQASIYDSVGSRHQVPPVRPAPRSPQQQQWINRYVPPSQIARHSPSRARQQQFFPSRPSHVAEPSPLHPGIHTRPPHNPGHIRGQLPPNQGGHPPPLPPPGALPHVVCQHCEELLMVPFNLPPPKSNTQKLRCGACAEISVFSVPQAEEPSTVPVSYYSKSDPQHGQPLLASSPDQAELTSHPRAIDDSPVTSKWPSSLTESQSGFEGEFPASTSHLYQKKGTPNPMSRGRGESGGHSVEAEDVLQMPHDPGSLGTGAKVEEGIRHGGLSAVGNVAAEDKPVQEVILASSDSEAELQQSRSIPGLPLAQATTAHTATEQEQEVPGRLNKALKGILGYGKSWTKSGKLSATGQYRRNVVVNGVAIPDHLVKSAQEQAGPIHPGTYWYDSQAGFWGVVGGPCLGIIPPFIDEFNHPISRDCAGGKTRVFVNGRELHHEDLKKLSARGLPEEPGWFYRIEIDGRVIEEALNSELRGLGRLAPSIEKKGRGNGMYVPTDASGSGSRT